MKTNKSFHFYIKPQLIRRGVIHRKVEYHSIFTSNHNTSTIVSTCWRLNIIPFLHQTTTVALTLHYNYSWISFHFYIKPQLASIALRLLSCWISFHFYIKPNTSTIVSTCWRLNIIPFLHQTTTVALTLHYNYSWISFHFYIKPQL